MGTVRFLVTSQGDRNNHLHCHLHYYTLPYSTLLYSNSTELYQKPVIMQQKQHNVTSKTNTLHIITT